MLGVRNWRALTWRAMNERRTDLPERGRPDRWHELEAVGVPSRAVGAGERGARRPVSRNERRRSKRVLPRVIGQRVVERRTVALADGGVDRSAGARVRVWVSRSSAKRPKRGAQPSAH